MKSEAYINQIYNRIISEKPQKVFVISDFCDLMDYGTAKKSLSRLESNNKIQKIMRGVYYNPRYSQLIQEYEKPSVDEVAKAIFEKEVKAFKYKAPADTWYKYLAKGESTYKADLNKVVNLVCISRYTDIMVNKYFKEGDILHNVPTFRAKELVGAKVAKIISE